MRTGVLFALAVGLALGAALPFLLEGGLTARRAPSAAPCPWSAALDAVAAAPQNHRVLLENERVRVLEVTVAPGDREPLHAHCWPSVLHVMRQGRGRDYDAEGRLIDEATEAPPASTLPLTFWLERSPPHSVENLDTFPIHLIRVELKPDRSTASGDRAEEEPS
jgi:hypothetical protein